MKSQPQILCVSANPAIDRRIVLPSLKRSEVNRATSAHPLAGGKAAHVAFAARKLGAEVTWIAFLGGPDGDSCREQMLSNSITPIGVPIKGQTRTNLELFESESGTVTEILEPGPIISSSESMTFIEAFKTQTRNRPVVVISGSLPRGLTPQFYVNLIALAKENGCRVLLDTSGEALSDSLSAGVDVVKPNRQEVSAFLGREIRTDDDVLEAANDIRKRGVALAIVSLGEDGALAATGRSTIRGIPPKVHQRSAVGSGDSFLAGWAVAELRGKDPSDCMRMAIACGAANCLAESPAQIEPSTVDELLSRVQIRNYSYSK